MSNVPSPSPIGAAREALVPDSMLTAIEGGSARAEELSIAELYRLRDHYDRLIAEQLWDEHDRRGR